MKVLRKAFKQELDPCVAGFVNSIEADRELIEADIAGSIAHALMLARQGLLSEDESAAIVDGLSELALAYGAGQLQLKPEYEDVHMNVEKQLEAKIGVAAARLHTARSRNDQVALDTRLYTAGKIKRIVKAIRALQKSLLSAAINNIDAIMPGYTHLQRAQPVLFAHALHAFVEMLGRDAARLSDCLKRTEVSPLGAAALAGSSLPVDPELTANLLGYDEIFSNSLDAVGDRDFAVEFLSASSISAVHLSQMAETLVIWASTEFAFVKFGDNVTTASSLMPNKKNPDPLELVRGKSGSIVGDLVNSLLTLKALPLGYNRDLQEMKPPLIHAAQTLESALQVMKVVLDSMEVQKDAMLEAASDPFLLATDLAEYLVKKGVPFRKAHDAVSELVNYARASKKDPALLTLPELKKFALEFDADVSALFSPESSIAAKRSAGGSGHASVKAALEKAWNLIRD